MNPGLTYEIYELAVILMSGFFMVCLFDLPIFPLKYFDVVVHN